MDKRVLLASVISMGVVLVWIAFFAPKRPAEKPPSQQSAPTVPTTNPAAAQAAAEATNKASDKKSDEKKPEEKPEAKPAEEGPPAPPAEKPVPVEDTLEVAKHYKATFTSEGAAPSHWVLLDPQYKEDNPKQSNKKAEQIDMVRTRVPDLPFQIGFAHFEKDKLELSKSVIELKPDAVWREQPRGSDGTLTYVYETDAARIEKKFVPRADGYAFDVEVTVENKSSVPQSLFFQAQMYGWQDPTLKPGGFMSRPVNQSSGACYANGKVHRGTFADLEKVKDGRSGFDEIGDVRWIGAGEQYFFGALALEPSRDQKRCGVFAAPDGTIAATLTVGERAVKPHEKTTYRMVGFMGPKILSHLDAVQIAGQSAHFGDIMEYRLWGLTEWLARPMLAVLKAIHYVVPSWGFAIIVLTILLKLLTWYPTQSSMKSMKAMAKLKPQMDKLKEKYGDDKNALNMATMELYRKEGVNPLGGCLPVLIQMPIYIALYSMLGNSVELYRSPFLWVHDLTAPDPFYILPIATGVLMFLQQKTQPTPADQNQKMMMYMMPVMFTVFNLVWPAGLTVYILTNTVLTFVQQLLMNKGEKPNRPKPAPTAKPARA